MNLLLVIIVASSAYGIGYLFFRSRFRSPEQQKSIAGIALLIGIVSLPIKGCFGERVPGAFLERAEYQREFYINLFPDKSASKNYRVPGLVRAVIEEYDDYEGDTYSQKKYYLDYVRFPNGGTLNFDVDSESLHIGRKARVYDTSGKGWYAELTTNPID